MVENMVHMIYMLLFRASLECTLWNSFVLSKQLVNPIGTLQGTICTSTPDNLQPTACGTSPACH